MFLLNVGQSYLRDYFYSQTHSLDNIAIINNEILSKHLRYSQMQANSAVLYCRQGWDRWS